MTTRVPTQCVACARFVGANSAGNLSCKAYPGGIPNRIVFFGADHRRTQAGDHGLTFELKAGAERDFARWQTVFAPEEVQQDGDQEAGGQEGGDAA